MTAKELAKAITTMNYGELVSVAADFASMCEDKQVRSPPKSQEDFANLIWDWAEAESETDKP